MTKTKVLTRKGVIEIDLRRAMFDFMHKDMAAYGKHRGATFENIALNFNRKYQSFLIDERIKGILASLGELVKTKPDDKGKTLYSLVGDKPVYEYEQAPKPPKTTTSLSRRQFASKVRRTSKGQAKITLPKELYDELGMPQDVRFELGQDCVIIRNYNRGEKT